MTESTDNGKMPTPRGQTSELLRFATAGSVDDGKSTLIGRLLYDSKQIFQDQMDHVTKVSEDRGHEGVDLALLTDGLRAEREQGITIDVAYRYFATPRRKFIIADTPGHISYTRNMVTGASTADLSIILVDARHGVVEQSRRHTFLNSLLNIPHLVVAINKMDLVDYDEAVYEGIVHDFGQWAAKLDIHDLSFIPMSALNGDNVVDKSDKMPWYKGPSLLYHLEHVHIASDRNLIDNRFPVQRVIRPQTEEFHDYRGYAGVVSSGVFKVGDDVIVLPSKRETRIAKIDTYDGPLEEAFPPLSVTLLLEDDEDISRGDMICRVHNQPQEVREFEAMVCWMDDVELKAGGKYAIKHTTRDGRAIVQDMRYKIDVNTLHRDHDATTLGLNDIGRVHLKTSTPLFIDEYRRSRATGSFILIDENTNRTVGAGMITGTESWAQPTQH
jgi:bifunctional enzyme CysN/CysC